MPVNPLNSPDRRPQDIDRDWFGSVHNITLSVEALDDQLMLAPEDIAQLPAAAALGVADGLAIEGQQCPLVGIQGW